jgi:predicted nucleic acid-binding protein
MTSLNPVPGRWYVFEENRLVYLLDTNVISEFRRPRPHGVVVAWLEDIADDDLHLSAVTLGELQVGVDITREQDPAKAAEIEASIDQVAQTWNVLSLDGRTLRTWAKLMHRQQDHLRKSLTWLTFFD